MSTLKKDIVIVFTAIAGALAAMKGCAQKAIHMETCKTKSGDTILGCVKETQP